MTVDVDYLRRLRRQKRLCLDEVASVIGKSRSTMWRYENARVDMAASTLLHLARFYGVSVDQLTTDKALPH